MLKYLYLCVAVILITTISGCSSTPPPSNGLIAFISDRGGTKDIYIMKADGTGQTQLTKDSGYYDWLDWSPNGKKLSFGTIIGGKREIFVMNSDGSNQTQLTFEGNNDQAEWSPDSSMIAFVSDRDIDDEVYVMGADGSNQTNLTKNPHEADITPVWSPNGNEIFYLSQIEISGQPAFEYRYMNNDGSRKRKLESGTLTWEQGSSWSMQTGKDVSVSKDSGNEEITVDGKNITNNPASDKDARWSPDGRKIAFTSNRTGNYEIYIMNSDGSELTQLTNGDGNNTQPAWQLIK